MAHKQPAKDAVSAAMSAIETALNLSGDGHSDGSAPPNDPLSGRSPPPPQIEPPVSRRLPPAEDVKTPLVADPPANDDRPAIGPIVQALAMRRLNATPVVAATVGSLLWLALCAYYAVSHFPWSGGSDAARQFLAKPETVLLGLAALGPMILFFGFAALARRLQELRQAARSITQVALRLAEPETVASENVASLAQAIRREIGTMGDGIERALARAAELETLVRSEVTTLERAYSDNERRIRSLIAEMADQREAILASGGRVRAVIDDAHRGVANDLEAIAIRLGERVSGVGSEVATSIGVSAEEVTEAMDRAGGSAVDRINAIAAEVSARLAAASGRSAEEIIGRVADIDQRIRNAGESLASDFAGRNEDLVGRIEASGATAVESLRRHADGIVAQLGAATAAAGHALDDHDQTVVGRIADSGALAAEAIRLHGDAVATRLAVASESLAREFGQRIDELIERVESSARGISDTVVTHGDGLASRLDVAVERLHESVVVRGQSLEDSLAAANSRFDSTLSGKTEDARALFESAGAAWAEHFDARHAQLRALIDDSSGVIGGQIEESARRAADAVAAEAIAAQERLEAAARMALQRWSDETREVGDKFTSAASEAVASIAVGGDSVNDAIGQTISNLEDTLSARGGALVADLNNQTRRIEEQLGALNALVGESGESAIERIAAHTGRLGETLSGHIESIDAVMSSRKAEIDERLNEHQAHLNQRLDEHRSRIDENLVDHRSRIDENLSEHRNRLDDTLADQRGRFDQTLGDHRQRLEEAGAARLAEFESVAAANQTMVELALSTHTRAVDDSLKDGSANLEIALTDRGRDIVTRIEAETKLLTTQLEATLNAIEQTVVIRGGELDQRLARRSQESVANFDSGVEAADSRASAKLDEVRTSFEKILERIDGVLAARAQSINENLARSTVDAAKTLSEGGREIAMGISAKSAELEATLRGRAEALSQALGELAGDINAKLADRLDDMSGTLGASVTRFRDDIVAPLHTLSVQLQSGGAEIAEAIGRHAANLGETVESHVQRIGAESTAQLVARIEEMRGLIEGPAADLVARIGARGDEVADQIAGVSVQASQSFEQQISSLVALLTRRGDDLLAAITATAAGSVRELGSLSGQIGVAVESSTAGLRAAAEAAQSQSAETIGALVSGLSIEVASSAAGLRAAAEAAQSQSAETIGALVGNLTTEVEASTAALRAAAEAAQSQTAETIGALVGNLMTEVEASTAALRAAADTTQNQSAETIGALISNLTAEIERSGASLRDAVETNAGASISTLNASSERMRTELGQVLERLGQVGSVLDRMVGAAGERLVAIEGGLGEKIELMQQALGAMADQVSALDRLSNETRDESGALVERLSGHTAALAVVARDLAANQHTVDASLELRHASLKVLFGEIAEKSQEFDAVARHFATSFEDSFTKAQARAQEISASLAVSTKNAASNAVSQFEMIRDTTGRERLKTAEALQAAYDQANANLEDVMTKTAERFRDSVNEVRQMAAEVQRQLDETRRELRRGVFELPEETAEAATAMRRVVADQIAALKELTAVVTASGADFDVSEPTPAKVATRPETPRKAEPAQRAESESEGETLTASPPAEPPRPAPAAPAPAAATRAPRAAAASPERSQSGWLSSLLAAASRDEAPAAPASPAANEAPDGISLDVAKYVDTEAAAEMWDRWRAGDGAAASRRLYTAAGQQSFDEIRRRYRSDPQFQDAVNRYTQEFERLLARIGETDRDGAQSRATLLSDAGKVYTMLAHASGRLG